MASSPQAAIERIRTGKPLPLHAQTEVAYQVASLTPRPGDPHIGPAFFVDRDLKSPSQIADDMWSMYDSELTVYLAQSPPILDAIYQFGHVYAHIVGAQ